MHCDRSSVTVLALAHPYRKTTMPLEGFSISYGRLCRAVERWLCLDAVASLSIPLHNGHTTHSATRVARAATSKKSLPSCDSK